MSLSSSNPITNKKDWLFYSENALNIPPKYKDADFADSYYVDLIEILIKNPCRLFGDVGTGKTWHLYALQKYIICKDCNVKVIIVSWSKYIDKLTKLFLDNRTEYEQELENLLSNDVIMLDDIGVEKTSDHNERILYRVIDECYNYNKRLYTTSNLKPLQFSNVVGDRVDRRINSITKKVELS